MSSLGLLCLIVERIAEAEGIASKYDNKAIVCSVGAQTWTICLERDLSIHGQAILTVFLSRHCVYAMPAALYKTKVK